MLESIEKLKRKITEKYGTHELPKPFAMGETIDETMGKAIANVDEMGVGGGLEWVLFDTHSGTIDDGTTTIDFVTSGSSSSNIFRSDVYLKLLTNYSDALTPIINNGEEDMDYLNELVDANDEARGSYIIKGWENYDGQRSTNYLTQYFVNLDNAYGEFELQYEIKTYTLKYNGISVTDNTLLALPIS